MYELATSKRQMSNGGMKCRRPVSQKHGAVHRFVREKWSWLWFCSMVGISIFLLGANLFGFVEGSMLGRLNLGRENNVAAWWSGMLLLVAGLHAFDGYFLLRRDKPDGARGWAAISLILVMLSADEIGSIHERANSLLHLGIWWSLLPFAMILLSLFGYALVALWRAGEPNGRIYLIIAGFSMFGMVAVQEWIEHLDHVEHLKLTSRWFAAVRQCLEEGSELFGMLILIKACMNNSQGLFAGRSGFGPTFDSVKVFSQPILIASLVIGPILAYMTANLPDQRIRGRPSDWLAASLFIFAALSISRRFLKYGEKLNLMEWGLIVLCCFSSMSSVACSPEIMPRMVLFFSVAMTACIFCPMSSSFKKTAYLASAVIVAAISSLALLESILVPVHAEPFYTFQPVLLTLYALPSVIAGFIYYMSVGERSLSSNLTAVFDSPLSNHLKR